MVQICAAVAGLAVFWWLVWLMLDWPGRQGRPSASDLIRTEIGDQRPADPDPEWDAWVVAHWPDEHSNNREG